MSRRVVTSAVIALALSIGLTTWPYLRAKHARQALFAELAPVALSNCGLQRFGDAHDGGYLLCGTLLNAVQAAYSYGIEGRDEWGCHVSRTFAIAVHQYDCFDTTEPPCSGGETHFNAECVGPEPVVVDDRPFETMLRQVTKNGDAGKRLVIKMDVEGSEWRSLLTAPDALLNDVDQLAVEFHGVDDPAFVETIRRLKRLFHVVHVHQNNFGCEPGLDPFTGSVFEVLFVSRRLAAVDPSAPAVGPHPLDAPNAPWLPDCQELRAADASSEFALYRRWLRRVARAQLPSLGL